MGTYEPGKVIPFTAGDAGNRANADGTAREQRHALNLSRRRGLDSVDAAPPPRETAAGRTEIDAAALSSLFIGSLDDLIGKRPATRRIAETWPSRPAPAVERVAVDIVDMLFGFIVDAPGIPDDVRKALLAAQLPVLQLAVREPEFFADWQHPARLLLNDIARLARTHAERGGDATAFAAEFARGLSAVLDELAPNGAAFAMFHERLRGFVRGSAPPVHADAWARAEAAARRILERPLPQIARDFVADCWIDVLERIAEAHDESSPHWQDALATVEDLAWSLTPKHAEADRFRLIALIPPLLARLNRGLDLIALADEARRPFFESLVDVHAAMLRIEPVAATQPARTEADADDSVARLQRGGMVEFRHDDGSVSCERLTWISPRRALLVFSNSHGQRAIQITPDDLAERVRRGTATLIFDPAGTGTGRQSA